jgi:hypothetical protein
MTRSTLTDHPTDLELERYAKDALAAGDLLRVDDHLAMCHECQRRAVASMDLSRRLGSAVSAIRQDLVIALDDESRRSNVLPMPDRRALAARLGRWGSLGAPAAAIVLVMDILWGARTPVRPTARHVAPPVATTATPANSVIASKTDSLTEDEQRRVDGALASGRVRRAHVLDMLLSHAEVLMGEPTRAWTFAAASPVGVVVDEDRPTFVWSGLPERARCRVSVFDESFQPATESGWQTDRRWASEHPLARGKTYTWQVTARVEDREITAPAPPQGEARFTVTSAEEHSQLAALRKRAGDSHLALAVLLAEAGVLDEAERELRLASAASPSSSAVKRLQANLGSLRR